MASRRPASGPAERPRSRRASPPSSPPSSACRASSSRRTWARRSGSPRRTTSRSSRRHRVRPHVRRVGGGRGGGRRTGDRGRRARRHRPGGLRRRRDHPRRGVLQLRGQVRHRRRPAARPGAAVGGGHRACADSPWRCSRCCAATASPASTSSSRKGGRGFLCNEANTMPGFTPISMFPKLWQAAGLVLPGAHRSPRRAGDRAQVPAAPQHQAPLTPATQPLLAAHWQLTRSHPDTSSAWQPGARLRLPDSPGRHEWTVERAGRTAGR